MSIPPNGHSAGLLRIVVADDHPLSLAALIDLITEEPSVRLVGAALRVDDAITLTLAHCPDVVLVDVHMPDGGGERVASTIREVLPGVRIVALSAHLEEERIRGMLSAGADRFEPKEADFASLMRDLVREHHRGSAK
ncbi:response regulator transcription factor [Geodermatophilus sp. SYSU D01062]